MSASIERSHSCGARHWFTYHGHVGSSSPKCVRFGCEAPNPKYRPDDDLFFEPPQTT